METKRTNLLGLASLTLIMFALAAGLTLVQTKQDNRSNAASSGAGLYDKSGAVIPEGLIWNESSGLTLTGTITSSQLSSANTITVNTINQKGTRVNVSVSPNADIFAVLDVNDNKVPADQKWIGKSKSEFDQAVTLGSPIRIIFYVPQSNAEALIQSFSQGNTTLTTDKFESVITNIN